MREPIEQRRRHLGVAEHATPLAETQVGGDHDAGALLQLAGQVEQQRTTRGPETEDGPRRRAYSGASRQLRSGGHPPPKIDQLSDQVASSTASHSITCASQAISLSATASVPSAMISMVQRDCTRSAHG